MDISVIWWQLTVPFTIARETQTAIGCIQLVLTDAAGLRGRAEAIGVDYDGETPETMVAQIEALRPRIEAGLTITDAQALLPAGGARNALDCALWDLAAKQSGIPAWQAAGLASFEPRPTAFTLGIMDETALRIAARKHGDFALLKIKTDRSHGLDPVRIVHEEVPQARLIVDANELWGEAELRRFSGQLEGLNVALLEQPVHPDDDEVLRRIALPVPVAADEAFDDRASLAGLAGKYQVLNIKLDKSGGLTEALACAHAARAQGFGLMIGCMAGSSLSMAPGVIIAQLSSFVDLDGPLLQDSDVANPVAYHGGFIGTPAPALWG